jgi:hypothetical protein
MPRKSRQTIEDEAMIDLARSMANDATLPQYIRTKALGSYNAMRQRMERQKAVKAAASAARKGVRDQANRVPYNWLPERGEDSAVYHARVARQKAALSAE